MRVAIIGMYSFKEATAKYGDCNIEYTHSLAYYDSHFILTSKENDYLTSQAAWTIGGN